MVGEFFFVTLGLRDYVMDDVAMHICQAEVAAGIPIRELLVIQSHQMKNRGVQVMNVDSVFDR